MPTKLVPSHQAETVMFAGFNAVGLPRSIESSTPSRLNACPTLPACTNVAPFCNVPFSLVGPKLSFTLPSADQRATRPEVGRGVTALREPWSGGSTIMKVTESPSASKEGSASELVMFAVTSICGMSGSPTLPTLWMDWISACVNARL